MKTSFEVRPERALLHPAWLAAVALLLLNDHVLKGSGLLPGVVTGKLSDAAGLFAAPALLAALCRVRGGRGLLAAHGATGLVFAAIKASAAASGAFVGLLALAGLRWRNWVDPTDLLALPALWASWRVLGPAMVGGEGRGLAGRLPILLGLPAMLASGNAGGANEGGRAPGNGDKGVNLALGEIAVDPQGRYFLSQSSGKLMAADLDGRQFSELAGVPLPTALAFWPASKGQGFFLVANQGGTEKVASYDLAARKMVWQKSFDRDDDGLQADEAGQRLVLWGASGLVDLDAASGATVGTFAASTGGLTDVDLVGGRVILTERDEPGADKLPVSRIHLRSAADFSEACPSFQVPNCADELVVTADGKRAFLAPTFCGRDPVSVIDLAGCKFQKNLPGFGPVALSSNGLTAVAFLDRDSNDPLAPAVPDDVKKSDARYHLMFIDTATLTFGTTPVGEKLPRYAVTPDGQMLLVDAYSQDNKSNVRIIDVASRSIRQVEGPSVVLENYVLLPDSSAAFAIHLDALYQLDIAAAATSVIPLNYTPTNLNMTPSGDRLLLKDSQGVVHLFSIASRQDEGAFSIASP